MEHFQSRYAIIAETTSLKDQKIVMMETDNLTMDVAQIAYKSLASTVMGFQVHA